jgi:DNA-directed RNA polymerase specialized sigma24 family protein
MSGRRETPDDAGVGRSYGDLYVEYAPAARGLALSMVPPDVADDIVAEAFARVLAAIRAGGGPITRSARTCSRPCATWRTTG